MADTGDPVDAIVGPDGEDTLSDFARNQLNVRRDIKTRWRGRFMADIDIVPTGCSLAI